jgi:hypothetical protein
MERLNGSTGQNLAKGFPAGLEDLRYDDALIAYAELGGALNEIEQQRLYRFGYWGDFRKRLEELLQSPAAGD